MNPNIVDPLPAGAMTWAGKTQGPAINVGRVRPHILGPRILYVHLDELRDWVVKAGWHTEKDYGQLESAYNEAKDLLADADAKIEELESKVEALGAALGWKPQETNTHGDGADRERELSEGRSAPLAGSAAGAKDSTRKAGGGKGRAVRAKGAKAG